MRFLVVFLTLLGCAREDRAVPPMSRAEPAVRLPANAETALLAGGCFWGMEEILRKIPGVVETEVGYVAGAESVRVVFDPAVLSYATLLERWYFRMHDPTTKNRQGNDVGTKYRSAIFYLSDAQRATAEDIKERVDASGKWKAPIVTEIAAATDFTVGEGFHQDFLQREPNGYTCHYLRD
ncbi:MAG: peptide-methionine (S)-S-oxide reductase MsrA [Deltaproteobacteria bacterium]|nr:peptide-methionine (S)-S-oxide reductase MsrA [Deltaproteobacteria bacterium]